MEKRMYVLVRSELEPTYRAVQGGHALAQFCQEYAAIAQFDWKNKYLIYVTTRFESGIIEASRMLAKEEIPHSLFSEPDLCQFTALTVYCDPEIMKDFPLAR